VTEVTERTSLNRELSSDHEQERQRRMLPPGRERIQALRHKGEKRVADAIMIPDTLPDNTGRRSCC
jgi:hypothetical protein